MTKKEKPIGQVTHFFDKIKVAIVKFSKPISVGDKIRFSSNHTDFEQEVDSMQIDHESVKKAKAKVEVGIKVKKEVRQGDEVYLV